MARGDGRQVDGRRHRGGHTVGVVDGERVDGHGRGRPVHDGSAVGEAFGMSRVGVIESRLATSGDVLDAAVEYIGWGEEGKSRVLMIVIVPGEELLAPGTCVSGRGEALRIVGLVLERLELGLGEGVHH